MKKGFNLTSSYKYKDERTPELPAGRLRVATTLRRVLIMSHYPGINLTSHKVKSVTTSCFQI